MKRLPVFLLALCLIYACSDTKKTSAPVKEAVPPPLPAVERINYTVARCSPHDMTLFTEGLLFYKGMLLESTGSPQGLEQAKSLIGISDLETGKFTKKIEIDRNKYFGEGIVVFKDKLYQLTYKNQLGFIYDAKTFKRIGQFNYPNAEGWGMTTDGSSLIMSDGTSNLTYLDPQKLSPTKTLRVTENGFPRDSLNELEFIKGFIYANVWTSSIIVKIDPKDGRVVGKIDLSLVVQEAMMKNPQGDVLNGIAYDAATDKVYVTGKMWANIYQIDFAH